MAPLTALLFSDGRPGHYHLAEGILAAAARLRPIKIERVEIDRRRVALGRMLARMISAGAAPATVFRFAYGMPAYRLPKADFVVSAGGDTLAANVTSAKLQDIPNIYYGSIRYWDPALFSLVLTSHQRLAVLPRHVVTLKPTATDPAALPVIAPFGAKGRAPAIAGLLIGGETDKITYRAQDWSALGGFLEASFTQLGTRWIVSNSRRTPSAASDLFCELAERSGGPILSFIDVRSEGAGTLGELFEKSEAVLCTVDSSSMVSEGVWMRRPMLAIAPQSSELPLLEQDYRNHLEQNGWARSARIADLTPSRFMALLSEIRPLTDNPLDQLAAKLKGHLPQLFP